MEELKLYSKELKRKKVMTPERLKELGAIYTSENCSEVQKNKIRNELIEGNLRYVITEARKFMGQGMEIDDLVAEGNLGLIKAAERYDFNSGNRFLTYAVWWIRAMIMEALNEKSRTIRIPTNVLQEKFQQKKNGEEYSDKIKSLPSMIDLSKPISEDGDTLLDVIININADQPDAQYYTDEMLKKKTVEILEGLTDREKFVVKEYYGFTGAPRTLEDIGDELNLTKERIRQIKEKALRNLRSEARQLYQAMEE